MCFQHIPARLLVPSACLQHFLLLHLKHSLLLLTRLIFIPASHTSNMSYLNARAKQSHYWTTLRPFFSHNPPMATQGSWTTCEADYQPYHIQELIAQCILSTLISSTDNPAVLACNCNIYCHGKGHNFILCFSSRL
jgi:hypothetical protein